MTAGMIPRTNIATRVEIPSADGLLERPMWIDGRAPIFAVHHPPVGSPVDRQARAVLFCAPFGWSNMAGYTVRRMWAQRLAKLGHPVLRFDLPGTGQSAGGPSDDDLVPCWIEAIEVAARWLRAATDATSVTAIGIGLGALLALQASADEHTSLDELVLWDLPASSRAILREMRLFGAGVRLITRPATTVDSAPPMPSALPPGWIESSGFTLSATTIAALEALPAETVPSAQVSRVMLLERDAAQPSQRARAIAERFRAHNITTHLEPGHGFGAMQMSPHLSAAPDETIATTAAWLDRPPPTKPPIEPRAQPTSAAADVPVAPGVRESAITIAQPSGTLFGVLAEPEDDDDASDLCIVCLPAMAQRCIGPARLWVELARRHAARGVPVFRTDLASVGESAGPPDVARDAMSFALDPDRNAQVGHVLDALEHRLGQRRFILVGLSSAGYLAEAVGIADERVAGVLSLNPLGSAGNTVNLGLVATSMRGGMWRRIVARDVNFRHWIQWAAHSIAGYGRRVVWALRRATIATPSATLGPPSYRELLEALQRRAGLLTVAVAEGEPSGWFLEQSGIAGDHARWPALRLHQLHSRDHELRPLDDQRAAHLLADEMVAELRQRQRSSSCSSGT